MDASNFNINVRCSGKYADFKIKTHDLDIDLGFFSKRDFAEIVEKLQEAMKEMHE